MIHPRNESWKPTVSDKIDMIETLLDTGSYCGLSINEVLDTKEARRAAALALAARELHAKPEIDDVENAANIRFDAKDQEDIEYTHHDKTKVPDAVSNSASKMVPPSNETRKTLGLTAKQTGRKDLHAEPKSTVAFRGTDPRRVATHVNPTETDKDFKQGGYDYTSRKTKQKERNIANAEKILGTKDKEGYGYSTNRVTPHIHAKIAAHKDDDDRAWTPSALAEYDRKWKAAHDAKAMRAHGKTQFAGNDEKGQQYHDLSSKATQMTGHRGQHGEYRDNLHTKTDVEAHDVRVKHYQDLDRHTKSHPPKYKDVELSGGRKGKVADTGHQASDLLKYHRELERYKTAKVRHEPVGTEPKRPNASKGIKVGKEKVYHEPAVRNIDADFNESCDCGVKPISQLNPNVHTPNIHALLQDLRTTLLRTPKTEREVMGGTFPSKYGSGNHIMAALTLPKVAD